MKTAFAGLAVFGLGIGLLHVGVGCEAQKCDDQTVQGEGDAGTEESDEGACVVLKSLKKFNGTDQSGQAEWVDGAPVTIDGRNGDITVRQGSGMNVAATFEPFVFRAYDTPDEVAIADIAKLNAVVEGDHNGTPGAVLVRTSRQDGAKTTLGADITVDLPPTFNGPLSIIQDNGQTDVDFAGSAVGFSVKSDNGSCDVTTGAAAATVDVFCDNGDLVASVGGVPAGSEPRKFATGNGTVDVDFSGAAGARFNVQAQARAGGIVDTTNAASAGCAVQEASAGSKTVSCNGATSADPTYQAIADGTGLADVVLSF
jgi:hypothetical protein